MVDERGSSLVRLARELVKSDCTCEIRSASGLISFRPATRQTRFHRTPAASSTCVTCRIKGALEADGLEHEEVDADPQHRPVLTGN